MLTRLLAPDHLSRTRQAVLAVLALVCALTSVALLSGNGVTASADPLDVHVQGSGLTTFADPNVSPGCSFSVDAEGGATAGGSFRCKLRKGARQLGLPFKSLRADVSSLSNPAEGEAVADATATATAPDGTQTTDIPATVTFVAGGPGVGTIDVFLTGVFDGEPGDTAPGDGNYTLWQQTVVDGDLSVTLVTPSPTPTSPSPTSTGPSPTPSTTPSSTPSPTPSASATSPGPTPTAPLPTPSLPGPTLPIPTPPIGGGGATGPLIPAPAGAESTANLMAMVAAIAGVPTPSVNDVLAMVGPFPVAGLAWWHDDWHAYRCCPYPHLHEGLDMFAAGGTPVVAAADGTLTEKGANPISGNAVEVLDAQGTSYFYAHLSAYAANLQVGQHVNVGQVLGYVGNTGDAAGGPTHLHFQIQPKGVPVPPMPSVDRWLATAEAQAQTILALQHITVPASLQAAWQAQAQQLAAGAQDPTVAQEGESQPAASPATSARLLLGTDPKVAGGAMMAFAAAAFLLLLLAPTIGRSRRGAPPPGP